jgi:hypothetical protein
MNKRFFMTTSFIVLLSAFILWPAVLCAADFTMDVPRKTQEHSQWCWAGSSQAVLAYYLTDVAQCTIANYAWNRSDCCGNSDWNWTDTCNHANCIYGTCGSNSDANRSLSGILSYWGVSNGPGIAAYLSWSDAVTELDAYRPFVIRFGWRSHTSPCDFTGGGHFLVAYGYDADGQYLDYMNPLRDQDGGGYTKSLYTWIVSASCDHDWTHTLKINQAPTAASCPENPVKISGTSNFYTTILDGYNAASEGQSVLIKALTFNESPILQHGTSVAVLLKGGYGCDFSINTASSTIHGLTIKGGTVTVENIIIK